MDRARYIFGEFELDAATFELQRCGARVRLERIPMELLLLLVSRRGELVSREEIAERLWDTGIFIDTNTAINVAIRKVRQALGDTFESPRYILTVQAKGYRFIGSISDGPSSPASVAGYSGGDAQAPIQIEAVNQLPAAATQHPKHPEQEAKPGRFTPAGGRWLMWMVAAIVLGMAVAAVLRSKNHTPAKKLMFVVLPFENLTGDPAQEYIADGMTEEMITQLGALDPEQIGVIARTSAMGFKGTQKSVAEIARELGVGYLLEGSVRHVGDRVRVTAQLIEASDQTHLWAADYDSDLSNLLQLESDIAEAIASHVQVKLDAQSQTRFARAVKPEAQAAYLRGLEDWNQRTSGSIADAISEFQRAIAADSDYPLPYAGLGRCYAIGPIFGLGNPMETMPKARESAVHALKLDPNLAEAHSILG